MKKYWPIHIILLIMLAGGMKCPAQSTWTLVNPMPPKVDFVSMCFAGPDKGWAVGDDGNIIHTPNGGLTWEQQYIFTDRNLYTVFFIDEMTGWTGGVLYTFFKTTDGGQVWQEIPFPVYQLKTLFFRNEWEGWAGTDRDVLKTVDGGYTWEMILDSLAGEAVKIIFPDDDHGYLITDESMFYRTANGGNTWTSVSFSGYGLRDVYFIDSLTGWMASALGKLYSTTDGGLTWDTLQLMTSGSFYRVHFLDSMSGIATAHGTCYKTYDGGITWTENPYPTPNFYEIVTGFSDNGTICHLSDHQTYLRSSDYGNSWEVYMTDIYNDLHAVAWPSPERAIAVGDFGTLISSIDQGKTWQLDEGVTTKSMKDIKFISPDEGWVVGSAVLLHTTDGGETWENKETFTNQTMLNLFILDENVFYACGTIGRVYRTTDGGETWLDKSIATNKDLYDMHFFDQYNGIVVGENQAYFQTDDGGLTWAEHEVGIGFDEVDYRAIHFKDADTGWLGSWRLYKTVDGGETWEQQYPVFGSGYARINAIRFTDEVNGWAVARYGMVLHTRDGGHTWSEHLDITGDYLNGLDFLDNEHGIIVGNEGILMRTERGSFLAPALLSHNADTAFCLDSHVQLPTHVIGDSLTFIWYFNDEIIPGADSSSLVIESVQQEDGGEYYFKAYNDGGIVENEKFIISTKPKAEVTASPYDTTVFEFDTVILNQAVTGALPILYQWQKNGEDIPGANFHIYPIYGVQLSDSGFYRCIVSNDCTVDTTDEAKLTVLPASGITDEASPRFRIIPNPVEGSCRVELDRDITRGKFIVFDVRGENMLSGEIENKRSFIIQTGGLSSGVYYLLLTTPSGTSALKFIKI